MTNPSAATSPQLLRQLNAGLVVRHALTSGPFTAADVMAATGLTRSTALQICDRLAAGGWLAELDDARAAGEYRKGRPARRYRLRPRHGHLVAVDAGLHRIVATVADLTGAELSRAERAVGPETSPRRRGTAVRAAVDAALARSGTTPGTVFVTVLGVPAPVDEAGDSPAGHEFWARMNPGLTGRLDGYGRVVVDNDANLAALAERARGAGQDSASFAALVCGEAFGAGLIVDDRLIRGRGGGAGELRLLDLVTGVGSVAGLATLARDGAAKLLAAGRVPAGSPLARRTAQTVTADDVFAAAAAGDRAALGLARRLGDRLARVVLVLGSLLDLERVIITGALAASVQPVIDRAAATLRDLSPAPAPDLLASPLGDAGVLIGAVERGLTEVRARPLDFAPFS
ncbi:ROK family transcriptional regulator [Microlunatus parietis]|uniref:Putative NBD/HSP70 family sugar kinase n=1 Tax=Microlunatus parietis TaxID=682979 RepID=A0A7Y9I502_9ACTN|nr:ROK family protein [Microlunatus parietis]NYE70359.1 putative NBD/HSP70 family sugar kinase [Microlunatus parietis]